LVKSGCVTLAWRPTLRRKLRACPMCDLPVYPWLGSRGRPAAACPEHRRSVQTVETVKRNQILRVAKAIGRAAWQAGIAPRHRQRQDLRAVASQLHRIGITSVRKLRAAARERRRPVPALLRRLFGKNADVMLAALGAQRLGAGWKPRRA